MRRTLSIAAALIGAAAAAQSAIDDDLPPPLHFWARGIRGDSGPQFEFAPASGAGLPVAQSLCSAAAQYFPGKDVSWCTNGDGTAASGTTLSVTTAQGSPVTTTQRVCPNGPDCAAVPVIQPASAASGFTEAANVDRSASTASGSFTACAAWVQQSSATIQIMNGLSSNNTTQWKYLLGVSAAPSTIRVSTSTGACGAGVVAFAGSIALEDGAPYVGCVTWASSDGLYRLYVNGVADGTGGVSGTICGGGSTSRFAASGFWAGAAVELAPSTAGVFGAFYIDTATGNGGQLSAAQILALSNAVLARNPTGTKGEALTFTRASARACESSTGLGSVVPSNVPCVARNGASVWQPGTVISARANELNNAYWTATAAVTANQARSFDGTLSADQLDDSSGAASQGVSVAIASTSATRHTFQCFVSAGTATSATISMTGTGSATGDCTSSVTGLTSTGQWISCTSPAAYAGTLTAVTPSLVVGDSAAVTGTIFASYCNHFTASAGREPALRTLAAGATRAAEPGLAGTSGPAIGPNFCMSASMQFTSAAAPLGIALYLGPAGTSEVALYRNSDTTAGFDIGTVLTTPVVASMGTTVQRAFLSDSAGTRVARWNNSIVTAPAASMVAGQTAFRIGANSVGGNPLNGTVSRVQIDSDPTRCTP